MRRLAAIDPGMGRPGGGSPAQPRRLRWHPRRDGPVAALPREEAVDLLLEEAVAAQEPRRPEWVKAPWINTERRFADTTREQAAEAHRTTRRRYATEINQLRSWWLAHMIETASPCAKP